MPREDPEIITQGQHGHIPFSFLSKPHVGLDNKSTTSTRYLPFLRAILDRDESLLEAAVSIIPSELRLIDRLRLIYLRYYAVCFSQSIRMVSGP